MSGFVDGSDTPQPESTSIAEIIFEVRVGGHLIPASQINIIGGAYGSVGHATIVTSFTALALAKIDLFDITSSSPGFTEVSITVQTKQTGTQQSTVTTTSTGGPGTTEGSQIKIFGGEYLNTTWEMDHDTVHIKARDWAGQLLDQKRILTKIAKAITAVLKPLAPGRVSAAGISSENQKIGDIVIAIAQEFGFNPILNLSDGKASGKGNPTIGTLYGSGDQVFMTVPQSLWAILNQMARDTGYVVYVTPTKDLVFGEPGAGLDTIHLSYDQGTLEKGFVPCKDLKLEHHPRRNSSFRVLVISYDPTHAQSVVGRAAYIGANYAGQKGIPPGVSSGSATQAIDKVLAKEKLGTGQVALYTFHVDGLDQQQADLRAATIATDIAKREVIVSAALDGLPSILPTQKIQLVGRLPDQFTAPTYYVSQYNQQFRMPSPDTHRADAGWLTHLTALNIPTEALAKSTEG